MIRFCILLFFTALSTPVYPSDTIVGGLSSKSISINTTFTGSDLLIFGSIKRHGMENVIPSNIIIEILGPPINITIREKKKVLGIWVNTNPIQVSNSPSFYSLLYTKKPELILNKTEMEKTPIGKNHFFYPKISDTAYIDAIKASIRIKSKEGFYFFENVPIILKDDTLFSARISLPANLVEGDYKVKIHLIQNKKIINSSTDIIEVRKVGLERWLYSTAHEQSLFYGIFSIFLALLFGWGASSLFRRF